MAAQELRTTRWLGMTALEAKCPKCGCILNVSLSELQGGESALQRDLKEKFLRHKCKSSACDFDNYRKLACAFGMAVVLFLSLASASCGGGGGAGGGGEATIPGPPPPVGDNGAIAACAHGTVASYLGTTCAQPPAYMYWKSYTCTSVPSSICNALGPNGSNIHMSMDPNGHHTILIGSKKLWNVTAGQSVKVVISGTVYGATTNNNWPHFGDLPGQTGDGTENNKTTVFCGSNCVALNGVSEIPCTSTSPVANCVDQKKIDAYLWATAKFHAAPVEHPYDFTIEITLNGGITGTATLQLLGIHFS